MEITGDGLMLGAGTILAKMTRDRRGGPRLALDDEPRAMALLTTAYEQPIAPHVLRKVRRACELWNADEKALAHIHLVHANLPLCDEDGRCVCSRRTRFLKRSRHRADGGTRV
jgi:hypothetical protein